MTTDGQTIIALGIMALAVVLILRRWLGKSSPSSCCGQGNCSTAMPGDRRPKITELHQVEIKDRNHPTG